MSELQTKLEEIKRQKDTYIIPENLKKDIKIFEVTGTYEGSGDVKLFETIEEMQEDSEAVEDDLAIVRRQEMQPINENTEFSSCLFPSQVILDNTISDMIWRKL